MLEIAREIIWEKLIKNIIVLMAIVFTANAFAGATRDLNRGLQKGYVKLQDVKANHWLEEIEAGLEYEYDFSENVSYIFEDIDEVITECGFNIDDNTDFYEQISTEDDYYIDWKKAVKRNKSRAYIAYLVVPVSGPVGNGDYETCNVIRGTYAVDRKGRDITDAITVDLEAYYQK